MLDPHKWLDRSFNGRRWLFVFIVFFIYCSKKEADTNTFLGSVKPSGGNKAKGQISKGVFQENIARQIYRKANIKIWRALFFWNTRFEIRSFALLPTYRNIWWSCFCDDIVLQLITKLLRLASSRHFCQQKFVFILEFYDFLEASINIDYLAAR